jgi:hypothetical protein
MMAVLAAAIGVILLLPFPVNAQSTLTFPRIMDPVDFAVTGYAVVGFTTAAASATFTLYDAKGNAARSSVQPVPPGGQIAKVGSDLFPGATVSGWVQVTSSTSNLRGFWLGGDWVNTTDGAEAASPASQLLLPLITTQSEIEIVNPTKSGQAILIRLYGAEGREITEPFIQFLPASGFYRVRAASTFPAGDLAVTTHARLTCAVMCTASVRVSNYTTGPSLAVVNGVSVNSTVRELVFPHVIQGQLNSLVYSTIISVTNLSAVAQTITLFYTPQQGGQSIEVSRDLAPNATIRELASTLFGFTNEVDNGWVRVAAEQPVAGIAVFAELTRGAVAVSPGLSTAAPNIILGHIADLNPWWSGVALLNPSIFDAFVDVFAIAPNGTLIGQNIGIFVPGGTKTAMLLSQWTPETLTRSSDGGFIFIRSTLPLMALELFFTRDQRVLSHVPGFPLGAAERFTPPPR